MKLTARTRLCLSAALCFAACLAAGAPAGAEVMKWTVGGVKREAIVVKPKKTDAAGKSPAILVFHGHGADMIDSSEGMRLDKAWPQAVVVYLQGLPTNPKDPQSRGWIYSQDPDGDRDLKFVDAVLATLHDKFAVDDRRIYVTGFSNGGMFTYVLWAARPNSFAAFAAAAGRIAAGVHLTEPRPILVIAGHQDMQVHFEDQVQAIQAARELNGSNDQGKSCGANCMFYASRRGAPVETFIHAGGHEYPPEAADLTVKFFKNYALEK